MSNSEMPASRRLLKPNFYSHLDKPFYIVRFDTEEGEYERFVVHPAHNQTGNPNGIALRDDRDHCQVMKFNHFEEAFHVARKLFDEYHEQETTQINDRDEREIVPLDFCITIEHETKIINYIKIHNSYLGD